MNTKLIATQDIVKNFGEHRALAGISLEILAGETVAIMGPSGSGKSTLLHCLSGVLVPDSGRVIFQNNVLSAGTDTQRSKTRLNDFGFVFQDGQLIPELTARENVAMPLMLTGTNASAALRAADETLTRLGLGEFTKRLPSQLSGGQAQRVAIARALVGSPKVIFADEPTGALDQATGHEVMQILTTSVKMFGSALVLVTHDLNVARWCGRLVEIRDGLVHSDTRIQHPESVAAQPVDNVGQVK